MNNNIFTVRVARRVFDGHWYVPGTYQEFNNEHDARTVYNKFAKVNRRKTYDERDHIEFCRQNVTTFASGARQNHGPQERIAVCGVYDF